ncbi:HAMP domain-containing protein [Phenylobacterium montanum]|uniref:HAMP domain-containing protein n=2 Tax=Phenylobacterium montanum TaxID=2823693 RepID=A0A975IXI3_9CAUL|nr:HAMP domain-containing protein [Caulobacter sp. S6]
MSVADPQIQALNAEVKRFNETRLAESKAQSQVLAANAARATWTMVLVGAAVLLGGLAFAAWISATKISAPLVSLADRMKILASGDLDVIVEGQGRGDEIGLMATAVQTFKDNGLRARALEAEAEQMRLDAERQRQLTEAERGRIQAEQAMVVQTLAENLGRLAEGDLNTHIDAEFQGDYLKIKTDFNSAVDSLREAMSAIASAIRGIRGGSDEIATASDDLSRRTEQQAASLEETAGALDQITATVKRSADGAKQAASEASSAREEAARSGSVMADAVSAMGEISQGSNQITQIISVIDEIAFQTNLLALNAGVEAARAGDAGRGFAVVAQEVRALAQRSAEAAMEIKTLIARSSAQVGRGVKLVGDTGQALESIVAKVASIDHLIAEIAQSSQEQAAGLNQVNIAVNQMDQVTQQNAAMVEQSSAATATLKAEAAELDRLISRFDVGAAARAPAMSEGRRGGADNARARLTAVGGRGIAARRG